MDFSAWDWANNFRLHEAACLIAGVMPISKKMPTSEELPPQARPILIVLGSAYYEWLLQQRKPSRPSAPFLEGVLLHDGTLPEFPSVEEYADELVSRAALCRYIAQNDKKSAYDFSPVKDRTPLPSTKGKASDSLDNDWMTQAQRRAREIIKRQKAMDLYPNQQAIADEIAKEFRSDGVVGSDGKPLNGSTIKRHALAGISSAKGKRLSTSIGQGKWGKQK